MNANSLRESTPNTYSVTLTINNPPSAQRTLGFAAATILGVSILLMPGVGVIGGIVAGGLLFYGIAESVTNCQKCTHVKYNRSSETAAISTVLEGSDSEAELSEPKPLEKFTQKINNQSHREEEILVTRTKFATREEDAFRIDFSKEDEIPTLEPSDFQSVQTNNGYKKLGKKAEWENVLPNGDCLFTAFRKGCDFAQVANSPTNEGDARNRCATRLGMKSSDNSWIYHSLIIGELQQAIQPNFVRLHYDYSTLPKDLKDDLLKIQSLKNNNNLNTKINQLNEIDEENEVYLRKRYSIGSHGDDVSSFVNLILGSDTMLITYISAISQSGVWGGAAELQALSEEFGVTTEVIDEQTGKKTVFNRANGGLPLITLKRVNGDHYWVKKSP